MFKKLTAFLLTIIMLFSLAGCGGNSQTQSGAGSETTSDDKKPVVKIAWWGINMIEGLQPALIEKFPDVDFEFIYGYNTTDFYDVLEKQGNLPDIITVRRFSLKDAAGLKDKLVDLSETDLAATFYQNYLQNYTFDDGVINWLPAVAECQTMIINKTLFEENNIDLPTDYEKFTTACEKFNKLGIIPLAADYRQDYECLEMLQGFSAEALQSAEGRKWRMDYESGKTTEADKDLWMPIFEKMYDVLNRTGAINWHVKDAEGNIVPVADADADIKQMMGERRAAMIRNGGGDVLGFNTGLYKAEETTQDEFIMLPYPGETEETSWVETYPYYQAAMSKESKVDPDLLMEIFEYIFSDEGQQSMGYAANMLSYSSEVTTTINQGMETLNPSIDSNHLFIRLANNDIFTASQEAVGAMALGEADAAQAYEIFNKIVSAEKTPVTNDYSINKGYDFTFDLEHGSEASSAVLNTCHEEWGTDLALMYAPMVGHDIIAGDASSSQLKYSVTGFPNATEKLTLTGAQIKELTRVMIEGWEAEKTAYNTDTEPVLIPKINSQLPVSSGFEMSIKKDGNTYKLESLTIDGKEISDDSSYTLALVVVKPKKDFLYKAAGFEFTEDQIVVLPTMEEALTARLITKGDQLSEPNDYIELK